MTRLQSHVWRQPPIIQALIVLVVTLAALRLSNAVFEAVFGWAFTFDVFDLVVPMGFAIYAYYRAVQRNRTAR